jgi:hypothetical protein
MSSFACASAPIFTFSRVAVISAAMASRPLTPTLSRRERATTYCDHPRGTIALCSAGSATTRILLVYVFQSKSSDDFHSCHLLMVPKYFRLTSLPMRLYREAGWFR